MSLVKASIDIAAPPEDIFDVMLDPSRLGDWVTIHRGVVRTDGGAPHEGYRMEQVLCLRGARFKVKWELTEHRPNEVATWEGRGPAHSYARTTYKLRALDGGSKTRFDYENEFKAPGGILGSMASRALIGGVPEREADRSLQRLKALLER